MANQNTSNQSAQQIADQIVDSPLFMFYEARVQAISNVNDKTDQLVAKMRRLAENLNRRADDIASRASVPNSLGEVQGDGVDIDRLCAQVQAAMDVANAANRALEQARKLVK